MARMSSRDDGRGRRPGAPGRREGGGRRGRGPGEVSLERALSKLGLATRSAARALVREGRVAVDGRIVAEPLAAVVPERVRIAIDGREASPPAPFTVMLHKPRGVVTTRSDPQGRPTVYGCLAAPAGGLPGVHLVPAGRLDAATSGLLLMTNDTRLADWVTDPAHAVPRVYLVTVRGELTPERASRLTAGVEDSGERLAASGATVRKRSRRETHLVLELTEGKNREVRRLLAALGHEVTALKRVAFGGLALGRLAPGAWRVVAAAELRAAFPGAPVR
ncbi:MAG TPA: pseudouridine synthase [Thermoanaerobaculia bacterium]|nr:pseudouridine synthase [Thermoanaerobaculia bacterium]